MSAPAVVDTCAGTVQALRAELERIGAGGGRDWSHVTTQIGMFAFTGLSARQARGPAAAPCRNRSLASQLAPGAGGACATYGSIGPRALPTSTLQQSCTLPCETTMPPCQGDRVGCGVPCLGLPALGDECSDGALVPECERCAVAVADPRCGRVAESRCFAWWFLAQVESLRKVEHVYLTSDGRMSLAGLAAKHVNYVAAGMARATKELP